MAFKVKAKRYIEVCMKTLARATRYENSFPKNLGYYDGTYLWGDCWCFNPKSIIWGEAAGTPVCDNYRVGQTVDFATGIRVSGLPDTTGDAIMNNYCTPVSFAKMLQDKKAPCLLLINGQHMGAYIGEFTQNGKTYNACEYTSNAMLGNGLCPSYVDQNGARRVCKGGALVGYWNRAGYLTSFVDYSDSTTVDPAPIAKLNAQDLANAIMTGTVHGVKVGNGEARKSNLRALGYTDAEIREAQDIINQKASGKPAPAKLSAEALANAIMSGSVNGKKVGNGQERINNLKAMGYTDAEIRAAQNIINQKLSKPAQNVSTSRKQIAGNLPTVQNGSQGEVVTVLQKALKALGFYTGAIDSYAGAVTVNAIKAAQTAWGITADGVFGPTSWNKLLEV